MHWLGCNDAVPWLTKRQVEYFDLQPTLKISKFTCISSASRTDGQPAVRPGCAGCRAPEISHNKGNGGGFTKMLFQRRFTHCAMAISFILLPFLVLLYSFSKVRISPKVTIACNGFCLLRHTKAWLAHDIVNNNQFNTVADVFACTLLHCELRDYSLGQIAFVFFERYLLSHC